MLARQSSRPTAMMGDVASNAGSSRDWQSRSSGLQEQIVTLIAVRRPTRRLF